MSTFRPLSNNQSTILSTVQVDVQLTVQAGHQPTVPSCNEAKNTITDHSMDLSAAFEKALEHIAADAAAKKQSDWFYEPESFLVPVDNDDSFDLSLPIILTEEEQVALAVTTIGDAVRAVVSADSLDMSVDSDVARDVIPAAATTDDGLIDDMSLMGLALDSFLGLLLAEREKDELANAAQIDNEVAMLIDTSLESLLDFPVFADEEEIEVTKAAAADEFTTLLIDTSIDSLLNFALVPDHETDVLQATLKSLVIPTIVLTAPDFPGSTSISSSVDTDFLCVPAIMSQRASRRLAHQASQDDLELMFAFLDDEKTELLTDMSLNDLVNFDFFSDHEKADASKNAAPADEDSELLIDTSLTELINFVLIEEFFFDHEKVDLFAPSCDQQTASLHDNNNLSRC
ncbi:hypothetical protein CF336_g8708 [Tilletia laevis]|uniref:Uncharacterized protein n=1 Tax=Tilletia caries TaxID=13290 RepID=A0A177T8B8_9BASI|nr:hypothetical protein CF336_g8708 [Tilletia laevis]KAE8182893.1 hypothetical protein CF335_g8493 [Tilletia laevis]KAE8237801.1 hypothetical protein A4X03_0g9033 [Tilletia caries]